MRVRQTINPLSYEILRPRQGSAFISVSIRMRGNHPPRNFYGVRRIYVSGERWTLVGHDNRTIARFPGVGTLYSATVRDNLGKQRQGN